MILDPLPTFTSIDGRMYEIDTDFRTSILFELTMMDDELADVEKIKKALEYYYPVQPDNIEVAINCIIDFYSGRKEEYNVKSKKGIRSKQIYNFDYDSDYIYAAFLSQYGIDLQDIEYLHWYKFKALFKALDSSNQIVKIMQYRATDITPNMTNQQKKFYTEMKRQYAIPLPKSVKEKANAIEDILMNGGDLSKLNNDL